MPPLHCLHSLLKKRPMETLWICRLKLLSATVLGVLVRCSMQSVTIVFQTYIVDAALQRCAASASFTCMARQLFGQRSSHALCVLLSLSEHGAVDISMMLPAVLAESLGGFEPNVGLASRVLCQMVETQPALLVEHLAVG